MCVLLKRKKQPARQILGCITKTEKAESAAQRERPPRYTGGNVVIDRRSDQLGKVLVCVHARGGERRVEKLPPRGPMWEGGGKEREGKTED